MAETTIIDISVQKTIDQVVLLKKSIQDLSAAQDTLNAEVKEGEQLSEEQAKQMEVLNAAVRNQKKEVTALTRVIDNSVKQRKAEVGSIEANRAELARLTAEIIKKAEPDKQMIARAKELSDTLKKQEGALGDTRRNVGNYSSALEGAGGILKKFGVDTSGLEQKLKSAREALVETRKRLIDIQGNLGGASGASQGFGSQLLNLGKSLFTTTKGLQLLKVALISSGIGAIVVVLGLLIAGFLKLEPVMNRITGIFNALGAIYDTVIGATFQFIQGIKNGEGVVNSFSKSFDDLGKNMSEAAIEAYNLVQQLDELEDRQRRQNLVNAQAEAQVKNLIIQSKDRTLTEAQRLAFLEDAAKIEKKAFEQQLELAKEAERLAQIEFDRSVKNGVADDELEQNLIEKQIARIQLESQSADLLEKIDNRKNALLDEQIQKQEKADEKNAAAKEKQRLADEKALKDKEDYYKLLDELQAEFETDERQKIEDSFNEKLALIKGNSEQELAIRKEIEQAKEKQLDEFDNNLLAQKIEKENQAALDLLETQLINARAAGEQIFEEQLAIEAEKQSQILENEQYTLEEKERLIAESNERILQINQEQADAEIALSKTLQDAKFAIAESGAAALSSLLEIFGKGGEAAAKFQKALAVFDIAVSAAKSLAEIIPLAIQAAAATGPGAPFVLGAYIASAAATVLGGIAAAKKALSSANEPKAPKFADGGSIDIEGASHAQGGSLISINGQPVAEAEGGEKLFVMKKSASAEIEKLSRWNQLFGGRSWTNKTRHAADGGQLFDGGFAARSFATNVNNQVVISELITASLKSMPTPEVKVTEINRVQRGVQQTVDVSSL